MYLHLKKVLYLFITIFSLLFPFQALKAQELIKLRSAISVAGTSKTLLSQGRQYYLQQSIGQSGIIGLVQNNSYLLRQGFIQPFQGVTKSIIPGSLKMVIFPDPFSSEITVSFSEEIPEILNVTIYDLNGRIVYLKKFGATKELNFNVGFLSTGIYFIKVNTTTRWVYSKIIKR
jgi:hypothetical protein